MNFVDKTLTTDMEESSLLPNQNNRIMDYGVTSYRFNESLINVNAGYTNFLDLFFVN